MDELMMKLLSRKSKFVVQTNADFNTIEKLIDMYVFKRNNNSLNVSNVQTAK